MSRCDSGRIQTTLPPMSRSVQEMSSDRSRSANSGGRLKRSYVDGSSNINVSNATGNNKKKTNQKTLGMAWGPNSRSSSGSFRSSPFSDFGSYMAFKNQKLREQFDAEASASSHSYSTSEQPIFQGVSIFVDGFTVPSSQELRSYMLKYGGRFENYFSRRSVTHIICSNLPDSKIKNIRSFSRGLPVVKPSWVLDCVGANKLLSWVPYQLDQLASKPCNQLNLVVFFDKDNNLIEKGDATHGMCHVKEEIGDSSFKDCNLANMIPSEAQEFGECPGPSSVKAGSDTFKLEESTKEINEVQSRSSGKLCAVENLEPRNIVSDIDLNAKVENQRSFFQPSASAASCCSENQNVRVSTSPPHLLSNPLHSTLGDPNFVDNYFKNSRLHFIGTWRNRYRKRFPSSCNGFKSACPNPHASASGSITIIHVDMDCFFVAVVIRNQPELQDKPVAVCHSDNPRGTAEISSANYPARAHGVRAGIFVRDAKALCPHLVILPYNFEAYEEVADVFYEILHKHCNNVKAVSCDEAFLELSGSGRAGPEQLASTIRREIYDATGCTASAGVGGNMLIARLATRTAKPDGQCCIPAEKVDDYIIQLPVKALPGVGRVLEEKLKKQKIETCGQLRMICKETLKKDFGLRTGDMLWNYCRGIDNRLVGVFQESKSLGAEVNWGVRFNNLEDCRLFISNLCKEVSLRLQGCGVQGRAFTLKIKKRRKDASEPEKFMGCGDCENLSHSITVPVPTDDADVLQRISRQLFGFFCIDVKDIRGIGLHVSKLESADFAKQVYGKNSLQKWLAHAPKENRSNVTALLNERDGFDGKMSRLCSDLGSKSVQKGCSSSVAEASSNLHSASSNLLSVLPPMNDLDMGVLESLPAELFSEMNEVYGGKLVDLIGVNKSKGSVDEGNVHHTEVDSLAGRPEGQEFEGERSQGTEGSTKQMLLQSPENDFIQANRPSHASGLESSNAVSYPPDHPNVDLMPSSLSQVDISVLQQLPEELRDDILEVIPAHRHDGCPSNAAFMNQVECHQRALVTADTKDCVGSLDCISNSNLWLGDPPQWVFKFKVRKCFVLNFLAEMYYKSENDLNLSSILLCGSSESQVPHDAISDTSDEVIFSLSELLKQYVKLRLESDLEEIYVTFRLFRRLAMRLVFPLQVYDMVFPFLQASVNDLYGGSLYIPHAE